MEVLAPKDLLATADFVARALTPAIGRSWSGRAGRLEWTVDHTLAHLTGAIAKYALYLASRSTRFIAVTVAPWPDSSQAERIDAISGVANALVNVAAASSPDARAYHNTGMVDAEGYLGLGCVELLVHGHDVAEGMNLPYEPPDDVCRAVVKRVFPWLSNDETAWTSILWHTGRIDIPGRRSNDDDSWRAVTIPLAEWDGTVPHRDPRPVIEWVRDVVTGSWLPRYVDVSNQPLSS